ncbi:hypothetical protein ABZY02_09695 [Streptomyces sp. NPDC006649]|uniref:hypothetical protein n=1 Tax=Streptomyces sp. NPDC006649 TaxID=3156896 RepID=UPI0033B8FFE4
MSDDMNESPVNGTAVNESPVNGITVNDQVKSPVDDVRTDRDGARPSWRASRAVRIAAAVLPAVLVLGAAAGGIAYVSVTAAHAATKAPTPLWGKDAQPRGKDPVTGLAGGRQDTELSKLLLPVPGLYRLGPDVGEYGNDAELTAQQAEAVIKTSGNGLSGTRRAEWNRKVEGWGVRGMGMRSYASDDNGLVVEVQLARIRDTKAVRDQFTARVALLKLLGASPGPKVEGHRSRTGCFLLPREPKSGIRTMNCFGYRGDVLVTSSATFTKAFHKDDAVALLGHQLDYLKTPGEPV